MKILHSADWHMNSWLGRANLTDDIETALADIARHLDREGADVLVVAGDLLSEKSRDEGTLRAISRLREFFGPFIARGGHLLAITGNHDSELRFETLRQTLLLGAGQNRSGRLILATQPEVHVVETATGERAAFALLPFPTARFYLDADASYDSLPARNRLISAAFARRLRELEAGLDPELPRVLVSHLHVLGAPTHAGHFEIGSDDVSLDPALLGSRWNYCAFGHIHRPGPVREATPHHRYSGSPVPLDAAERSDVKSCALVEIAPEARTPAHIALLDLEAPRLHRVEVDLTGVAPEHALAAARGAWPRDVVPRDLIFVALRAPAGHALDLPALHRDLDALPGRIYARSLDIQDQGLDLGPFVPWMPAEPEPSQDEEPGPARARPEAGQVAREFLHLRLREHGDRDALLERAEQVLRPDQAA